MPVVATVFPASLAVGVNFSVLSGVPTGRTRPKKGVGLFPTATRNQARGTTYCLLGFDGSEDGSVPTWDATPKSPRGLPRLFFFRLFAFQRAGGR